MSSVHIKLISQACAKFDKESLLATIAVAHAIHKYEGWIHYLNEGRIYFEY